MADMSKLEARIKMLEARRKKGESVPELDALYERVDAATSKAYKESSKGLSGDYTGEKSKAGESAIENMKQYGMKKGGMTVSKMEGGMKKVKKMAVGGMNAPRPSFQESMKSAGMNVSNLKTGDRSFSNTPTMGFLRKPPTPSTPYPAPKIPPPPTQVNSGGFPATYGPSTLPSSPIAGSGKFSEPSLNDLREAIKNTQSGKTIAGPMGSQLQSAANNILKGGTSIGSQRALPANPMKKGGAVKSSASKRADGCAQRGKTKGRMV